MSRNWDMLWQTAMLVVVVLLIFAALGTASFKDDLALGAAAEATREGGEDFGGCDNLGQVAFFVLYGEAWGRKKKRRDEIHGLITEKEGAFCSDNTKVICICF